MYIILNTHYITPALVCYLRSLVVRALHRHRNYMIHVPTMIKELGPLIRHSCFAFESAHSYFKELAPKQNFRNLPKSLAERCQCKECGNFADCNEVPQSHPLFSSEKNFGSLTLANEEQKRNLRQKLNISGLLPCIQLQNSYKTTWVSCYGTRFKSGGIFICNVDEDLVRPEVMHFSIVLHICMQA